MLFDEELEGRAKLIRAKVEKLRAQQEAAEEAGESKSEFGKGFLIRIVPPNLHRVWKAAAAMNGISMEDYALVAVQQLILKTKEQTDRLMETDAKASNEG